MPSQKTTAYITGKIYWAKVLGAPRMNYNQDGKEWTFELEPDEAGLAILKEHGLTDRLKNKYEDRGKYISLKKKELSADGRENGPIRIYDASNAVWSQSTLIGNASLGDVRLDIRDYGPGKKKGIYPIAIRIKDLIPYEGSDFAGMDGDTPANKEDAQDDEVPFGR